jgi:4-hydroxy-4-methyl-2-oxoglutarate aldolase
MAMAVTLPLIEQLREFETPLVAEALAAMGCADTHKYYMGADISLLNETPLPMVGIAMTLEADTSSPDTDDDASALFDACTQLEALAVPAVLVIKTIGSRPLHECVLGDGMAKMMHAVGCCGVVTDGGVRDLAGITAVGLTIFGRGPVVNHATLKFAKPSQPIKIGGIEVGNGDLVHGDCNGVHLVPAAYQSAVVEACILTRDFETRAHVHMRRSDKLTNDKRQFVGTLSKAHRARCRKLLDF